MFQQKFVCVGNVSVTDVLQVSVSKTIGKVEKGDVCEAVGPVCKDDASGMERVEARQRPKELKMQHLELFWESLSAKTQCSHCTAVCML